MSNISFLKEDFYKSNFFIEKFNSHLVVIDTPKINILSEILVQKINTILKQKFKLNEISKVHKILGESEKIYDLKFGINKFTSNFYEIGENFKKNFLKLLKENIRDIIGEDFYFQNNPTLRIQVPHETSEIFYPFFHSDIQLGHPPYGTNLWMPLNSPSLIEGYGFSISDLKDSIKTFEELNFEFDDLKNNKKKYSEKLISHSKLQNFEFGKSVLFDSRCLHSTLPLKNHTRASIDVRIVPVSEFEKFSHIYQGSGRKKVLFAPGKAYNKQSIDNVVL